MNMHNTLFYWGQENCPPPSPPREVDLIPLQMYIDHREEAEPPT